MNTINSTTSELKTYSVAKSNNSGFCLKSAIKDLIASLEQILSDPIIKYDITFSKKSYSFKNPIDDKEKEFYAKEREQLIKAMLKKAINRFIDNHYKYQNDEDYTDDSFNLIQHIISNHPTDFYISEPAGESYEVKIEDLNRKIIGDAKPCKCYRFETASIKIECDGNCSDK